MFLVSWFWNALSYLGLSSKSARICFLGLDNAGKTTLIQVLRDGKFVPHEPTRHPRSEELVMGNVRFNAYDLGGHAAARRLWQQYLPGVDGIVFLVDAADHHRMVDAKEELSKLMSDALSENVPIVILGNKADVKDAYNESQLAQVLGVESILTGKEGGAVPEGNRPLEIFSCSIAERGGYQEGFKWLAKYLP